MPCWFSQFNFYLWIDLKAKKLVGFARVLTDRFKYAYIYDFIVDPSFRKRKLGKYLLTHILEHPTVNKMQCVELTCRLEMIPFYEKFGFSADYSPAVAMRKQKSKKIKSLSPIKNFL